MISKISFSFRHPGFVENKTTISKSDAYEEFPLALEPKKVIPEKSLYFRLNSPFSSRITSLKSSPVFIFSISRYLSSIFNRNRKGCQQFPGNSIRLAPFLLSKSGVGEYWSGGVMGKNKIFVEKSDF